MQNTDLLKVDQVKKAIRFESPIRPPRCYMLWHNQQTLDFYRGDFENLLTEYPDDVLVVHIGIQYLDSNKRDDTNYRWAYKGWKKPDHAAIDNCSIITDWDTEIEKFLTDMPDPNRPDRMEKNIGKGASESMF